MSQIKSLDYPDSNKIGLLESYFEVVDENIQPDRDDTFRSGFNSDLWEVNKNNVTTSFNDSRGLMEAVYDASSNDSQFFVKSKYNLPSSNCYFAFDIGSVAYIDQEMSSSDKSFFVRVVDKADASNNQIEIRLTTDSNNDPVLEVEDLRNSSVIYTETGFGDTVTEKDPNNYFDGIFKSLDFKLVFSPNNKFYLFHSNGVEDLTNIVQEAYDLNGYTNLSIEFGLDLSSGATDWGGGKMFFKPFKMYPVLDTLVGDDIVPVHYHKDEGFCDFYFEPPYPADYQNISVYGCGTSLGDLSNVVGGLSVLDKHDKVDSKKFLDSKVENLYTDDKPRQVCRQQAREVNVDGDLDVNMECFCDGSLEDRTSQLLELQKTSEISNRYSKVMDNPRFKMKNGEKEIGYGFDFSRRFVDDANLQTSNPIKFLNSVKYDDNTVVYYGATYSPVGGEAQKQRIDIEYENVDTYSSEVDWYLYNVNRSSKDGNGDGSSDSFVSSGTKTSNGTDTHNLDRGRYRLRIPGDSADNGVTIRVYFGDKANGNRILEIDTRDHFGNLVDQSGTVEDEIDIFFEVKQYQGDLVIFVHDICDNSFEKYEKNVNMSLMSDSLGCLKNADGDLSFVYQDMPDLDVHGNLQGELSYEKFDIENGSWESTGTIDWPVREQMEDRQGQFIYAFDAVSSEEDHYFVMSLMEGVQGDNTPSDTSNLLEFRDMDTNDVKHGYPKMYPVVNSNIAYRKAKKDDFVQSHFESLEFVETVKFGEETLRHLKRKSFDQSIPDKGGSEENKIAYTGMSFFDCAYNEDRDQLVVAGLTNYRRMPFVYMGKTHFKGVYIPWHFDVGGFMKDYNFGKKYHDSISTYENRPNKFFSFESISACYANDGFVYTVATRFDEHLDSERTTAEIGLFEPSLSQVDDRYDYIELSDTNEGVGGEQPRTDKGMDRAFYTPFYKFQSIPISSLYKGSTLGDDVRLRHLSINSHFQYLLMSGGSDFFNSPFVMVNGEYDTLPFETPCEEIYYPEFGEATEYSLDTDVDLQGAYLEISNEAAQNFPSVTRDLTPSTVPTDYVETRTSDGLEYDVKINRGERANTGYKFHARMEEDFDGASAFGRDVIFQVQTAYNQYYDTTDDSNKVRYYKSRARFKGDGTSYKCQVYNGKDGVWETVDTISIESSSREKVKDFYILLRQVDYDAIGERGEFQALFVIKEREYVQKGVEDQIYNYDISSVVVDSSVYTEQASEVGKKEYKKNENNDGPYSSMKVVFYDDGTSDTTTDTNQDMRVYQMGWNLLKAKEYFRYNSPVTADDDSNYNIGGQTQWRQEIRPGAARFRSFNDAILFREYESPSYFVRTFALIEGRTSNFHWHNGFKFNFSGENGHIGDTYALERKALGSVNALMSQKLYGLWNSRDDDNELSVWADSSDSDLSKFYADMVVVDGVNVPKIDLLTGSNEDSLIDFDTLDLRRFYFPSNKITFDQNSDKNEYVVKVEDADFELEAPDNFDYYFYNETSGTPNITKVERFEGGKIHLSYNEDPQYVDSEGGYIFSSRAVYFFDPNNFNDDFTQSRIFGFKFQPNWNTFEGYYSAKTLDFGVGRLMPFDYAHDVESGRTEDISAEVNFLYEEQPYSDFSYNDHNYELSYTIADKVTFLKVKSMLETVGVNKYPLWLVESLQGSKDNVFLSLVDGEPSHSVEVDQDGEKFYELELNFTVFK